MAQFTNRASISYNGVTADSNIVTGEIVQVLTAEKTVLPTTYRRGDVLTYAVSIANSGSNPITGLTLTDDLGAYNIGATTAVPLSFTGGSVLYYVNGTLQAAPAVTPGAPLVISGISVPAGGSALIVYRAQVNDFAPPAEGGTVTNRALISGGGLSEPVAATAAARRARGGSGNNKGAAPDHGHGKRRAVLHLHDTKQRCARGGSGRRRHGL